MHYDLIIRHAHLHRRQEVVDIAVHDGHFAKIATVSLDSAAREIDAASRLVSSPFIDAHVQLDAVLTVGQPRYNSSGTLLEGIQIWGERKPSLTHEDVKQRALEEIRWEVAQGTLYIRSHVDVCDANLTALRALIEIREEVRDMCDLQLVAFPQDGIMSFPNGRELMRQAMELGCDLVGGIPHHEWTRDMGVEDVHYAFALIGLLARAQVSVVANPFDNVVLQGRFDTYPKRRGITRVKELLAAGVNVALGHDSIMDPWFPLGKGDMLAAAQLALYLCHMSGYEEIDDVLALITSNAPSVLRIEDRYGIEEGKAANFLVLDAPSAFEALRLVPVRLHVFKEGREVAYSTPGRSMVRRSGDDAGKEVTYRL